MTDIVISVIFIALTVGVIVSSFFVQFFIKKQSAEALQNDTLSRGNNGNNAVIQNETTPILELSNSEIISVFQKFQDKLNKIESTNTEVARDIKDILFYNQVLTRKMGKIENSYHQMPDSIRGFRGVIIRPSTPTNNPRDIEDFFTVHGRKGDFNLPTFTKPLIGPVQSTRETRSQKYSPKK
jgi:hypothetical protein